uniref:DNA polymerase I n=1 Tax=candidate division WOR-3 bacterium TaxID=2052148 RepID=A0A7V3PUL5_UNCW3
MVVETLVLIDAHSVLYRSYYAFIKSPLRNSRGLNTSAIFGFAKTLRKVLDELKPDFCAVVFDAPGKTFREERYAEYKAQRPKTPPELLQSIPYAKAIVEAWGLKIFELPGFEADDLIGTITKLGVENGLKVVIVSSDKDLLQLVKNDVVIVYEPYKEKFYHAADVKDKLGVEPEQIPDFLALAGDSVDNIPGIPGIGPKRAQQLLLRYGSLDKVLDCEEKIKTYRNLALLSRELAVINTEANVNIRIEILKPGIPDESKLTQLYQELEFHSLLKEINKTEPHQEAIVLMQVTELSDDAIKRILKKDAVGFAGEVNKGIWIGVASDEVMLVPFEHQRAIKEILSAPSVVKVGFNFKAQIKELQKKRLKLSAPFFDNCIGAWLVDPNRKNFAPQDIVERVLKQNATITKPAEEALWAIRVYQFLFPEIIAFGLKSVYDELEMPLVPVLVRMEERGVKIDIDFFEKLEGELNAELRALKQRIWSLAGTKFNISSPKQLSEVLFQRLKLPKGKKTHTGFSTSSDVLVNLINVHPIVSEILRYRELDKLCNTYLAPLPAHADPVSHRLHTSFNQLGTSTGRLSSTEPNLQNIPIRGELGKKIRCGFVADTGKMLISADYSQIELRVLAHFTGDERLISAFLNGEDIHAATASAILNIPLNQVTPEHRRIAKMVNYGLIYGMGDWGLSSRMDISIEQARAFMDEYFLKFPGVAQWRERITELAKRDGFVRTLSGRIRPVPGITSSIRQEAEAALRAALNAPMQGSAADIMKKAMIRVDKRLQEMGFEGGIILQIHDELLLEVEEERCEEAKEMVKFEMENAWRLNVPLIVEIGVGRSWGETH